MGSNVELVWPESEAYSSRVNNCSHANSSLAVIRAKLSAEQLEQFKTSCFGHLLNIDKIQFSGQIVHGVVLRRVAGQSVKDLDVLSFLIGCDVAQFTRQDFCLISGLRFGEVPEVSSGESDEIRLQKRYFIDEGITCNALEEAFVKCTEEDDVYKLALVYFAELVVLGRDKHLNINLNYLTLVEDLDAFNRFPWGLVSFDKTQDKGRGKGKSKVTGTSRRNEKGKKDNHGEVQRGGWSFKGFTYAFQICRPAVVSAESIPSSCADLDELNKAVSLLRSELFQVKREKDVLELKRGRIVVSCHIYLRDMRKWMTCNGMKGQVIEMKERKIKRRTLKGGEGPNNINEGEDKEEEGIERGEGASKTNEGEEKEEEGIEGGEVPSKSNEGEEKEEEGIEGGEVQRKPREVEEAQRKRSEGEQVKIKSSKGEEAQRKSIEGEEELQRKSSEGEDPQKKRRKGKEVKRQRSEEKEVQRNQCEEEDDEVMLVGDDIGEGTEGTKVEVTLGDIDLDQPTAVLSQLNVWLNDEGQGVERGVQLRKRKRIIPMWKIVEASEVVKKNLPKTTGLRTLDLMKAIPHDDMVKLLKLCSEWRHNPNLVMQFGNVDAKIEFFASLVKADGWLKGDHIDLGLYLIRKRQQQLEEVEISDWTTTDVFFMNHIHTCFADNKRKKEQVGWKIRTSLVNVVNGKVPGCGLDWQNTYKVIGITIPNLLHTLDFYEEGVYANECTRDWWCPWPIHRVDVPQQANQGDCGMFVLKYIELLSAEILLATCTSQNMPFFRLKLDAEIARGDAYMP
ncbi:unnamed protein product [Prunus armeniaca]